MSESAVTPASSAFAVRSKRLACLVKCISIAAAFVAWSMTLDATASADGWTAAAKIGCGCAPPPALTTMAAPEIDPANAVGALTLLLGTLAVFRGRRAR